MADLIALHVFELERFSWGNSSLLASSEQRTMYLKALQKADEGDYVSLIDFARSEQNSIAIPNYYTIPQLIWMMKKTLQILS